MWGAMYSDYIVRFGFVGGQFKHEINFSYDRGQKENRKKNNTCTDK